LAVDQRQRWQEENGIVLAALFDHIPGNAATNEAAIAILSQKTAAFGNEAEGNRSNGYGGNANATEDTQLVLAAHPQLRLTE